MKEWLKGDLIHETEKLRKLLIENPECPLLILAGEDANIGEYSYMVCKDVSCKKGYVLILPKDAPDPPNDELIYCEEDELEEDIADQVYNDMPEASDKEQEEEVKKRMAMFEPYWKECIFIYASN